MTNSSTRPQGFEGRGDARLPQITRRLQQRLSDAQRQFTYDSLRLGRDALRQLAGVVVDFADDLHNDIGIWRAYERYNIQFFGTALPITDGHCGGPPSALSADRIRHLLWVLYSVVLDGLVLAPTHRDLQYLAEVTSDFLIEAFGDVPQDSGIKSFLRTPNDYGWEVKRKLVWLGCHSYMFRLFCPKYLKKHTNGAETIGDIGDFLCQECTPWSGLGANDVLAEVLDVPLEARNELRSWYEWHAAFYKVLSVSDDATETLNVINERPYRIRINLQRNPFAPGQFVFGSLVPWRGEWYWSGEQKLFGDASATDVEDLKRTMKRHSSRIVCRYCPEYEALVRQRASYLHQASLRYHGKDLVVYQDGMSMAADRQKELRTQWESHPPEQQRDVMQRHDLTKGRPEIRIPQELLDHNDGIGVFLNPDEGQEIMTHFTPLIRGLHRRGENLTEDEQLALQGFFCAEGVSPQFVRRVLAEYGDESVGATFLLKGDLPDYWLDYLLRSHKGQFYRKRYPTLGIAG